MSGLGSSKSCLLTQFINSDRFFVCPTRISSFLLMIPDVPLAVFLSCYGGGEKDGRRFGTSLESILLAINVLT
jgi:hypothetical protein